MVRRAESEMHGLKRFDVRVIGRPMNAERTRSRVYLLHIEGDVAHDESRTFCLVDHDRTRAEQSFHTAVAIQTDKISISKSANRQANTTGHADFFDDDVNGAIDLQSVPGLQVHVHDNCLQRSRTSMPLLAAPCSQKSPAILCCIAAVSIRKPGTTIAHRTGGDAACAASGLWSHRWLLLMGGTGVARQGRKFSPPNRDARRGIDAHSHLAAPDPHDGDYHVIADEDPLPLSSREDEHTAVSFLEADSAALPYARFIQSNTILIIFFDIVKCSLLVSHNWPRPPSLLCTHTRSGWHGGSRCRPCAISGTPCGRR